MRHVALTCKNHPDLRWSCKSIAFSPGHGYNGSRHIFFAGTVDKSKKPHPDAPEAECTCSPSDLVLAPEDEWSQLSVEAQKKAIDVDVN